MSAQKENLLLISHPKPDNGPFLGAWKPAVDELLGDASQVIFIPYAKPPEDYTAYFGAVRKRLHEQFGRLVVSVHDSDNPVELIESADAAIVGGGSPYLLNDKLKENGLRDPLKEKIKTGMPYIGISSGAIILGPTIETTNIIPEKNSNDHTGLEVVSFCINPHVPDDRGDRQERFERLRKIQTKNGLSIIAMPDRVSLRVRGNQVEILGSQDAILLEPGLPFKSIPPRGKFVF
jgi:dipeptidase E